MCPKKKDYLFSNGCKSLENGVNFKLKYLCFQLSDRKVIICVGKVCSSSFRISPDFFDFDNSKGSYSRLKISSPFFLDTLYKLYTVLENCLFLFQAMNHKLLCRYLSLMMYIYTDYFATKQ